MLGVQLPVNESPESGALNHTNVCVCVGGGSGGIKERNKIKAKKKQEKE